MANFLKPNLPELDKYVHYLSQIWNTQQLTNNGPLVIELENRLKEYLGVSHLRYVSSGTMALQIAICAHKLKGEVITTPFSHISTTNALLWQGCIPKFVDIETKTFCINSRKLESSINESTSAILATHVYGYPCNVEHIEMIAAKYNIPIIYDSAHSFGVKLNEQSIYSYGDTSIVSFNATKYFHTIEGGAVITNDEQIDARVEAIRNFGQRSGKPYLLGINGKNSEFHAAMGLCLLPSVPQFIANQKRIADFYTKALHILPLQLPTYSSNVMYNFAYYPIILPTKSDAKRMEWLLNKADITVKKYFSPALNQLPYIRHTSCPVAEQTAGKVICLPMYRNLSDSEMNKIVNCVHEYFNTSICKSLN